MIALFRWLFGSGRKTKKLLKTGTPAKAKVLSIQQTHTTINNAPVVKFQLEVQPDGGQPFQAEAKRAIPLVQLSQIQPGALLNVRYDPTDTAMVAIA